MNNKLRSRLISPVPIASSRRSGRRRRSLAGHSDSWRCMTRVSCSRSTRWKSKAPHKEREYWYVCWFQSPFTYEVWANASKKESTCSKELCRSQKCWKFIIFSIILTIARLDDYRDAYFTSSLGTQKSWRSIYTIRFLRAPEIIYLMRHSKLYLNIILIQICKCRKCHWIHSFLMSCLIQFLKIQPI